MNGIQVLAGICKYFTSDWDFTDVTLVFLFSGLGELETGQLANSAYRLFVCL